MPPVRSLKDLGEHFEMFVRGVGSFGLNFKHLFELATWNPAKRSPQSLDDILERQSAEHTQLLTTQGMAERAKLLEPLLKKLK